MEGKLEVVKLASLVPHPDNPRLVLREEVVESIAHQLKAAGAFPEMHAPIVRPLNGEGTFQVLSGHTRRVAAERAGVGELPVWVVEADDSQALMLLVTCNSQGELSPLEVGLHALRVVGRGKAGRGKKGGLSAYAKAVGRTQPYLSQLIAAAEVVEALKSISQLMDLADLTEKAQHLYAVHDLPRGCWPAACRALLTLKLSVAETQARVKAAKDYLATHGTPREWLDYLPLDGCAGAVFAGTRPADFRRLLCLAEKVFADLPEDLAAQWKLWLAANAGGESWDVKCCQEKRLELEEVAHAREEAAARPPEAQVLLADPPWKYDFAETDSRQVENQYPTASVEEIVGHLDEPWAPPLAADCVCLLWATAPKLREALEVLAGWGFEYKTHAVWDKEQIGMGYWFRGQHELLLVGTRGDCPPPDAGRRVASVFRERRAQEHSRKPACVYEAVEAMFPGMVLAEMYQRGPARPGWLGAGNEAGEGESP
jgi:ParB/RepB/Spo0J family partition protein